MLTELDIINDMLRSVSTEPLTAEDHQHPSYIKALPTLARVSMNVQSLGYWFNTTFPQLVPNEDGELIVPSGTLHADPVDTCKNYSLRDRRIYDMTNRTFVFTEPAYFKIVSTLDLPDMPYAAKEYIRAKCKYEYFLDEDGSEPKLSSYNTERGIAWTELHREHLKMRDENWYNSSAAQRVVYNPNGRFSGRLHLPGPQE